MSHELLEVAGTVCLPGLQALYGPTQRKGFLDTSNGDVQRNGLVRFRATGLLRRHSLGQFAGARLADFQRRHHGSGNGNPWCTLSPTHIPAALILIFFGSRRAGLDPGRRRRLRFGRRHRGGIFKLADTGLKWTSKLPCAVLGHGDQMITSSTNIVHFAVSE